MLKWPVYLPCSAAWRRLALWVVYEGCLPVPVHLLIPVIRLFGVGVGNHVRLVIKPTCKFVKSSTGLVTTTQFYSVDFSQSRIGADKCVFNKGTTKVRVSCC